jgi:hypothetical protein
MDPFRSYLKCCRKEQSKPSQHKLSLLRYEIHKQPPPHAGSADYVFLHLDHSLHSLLDVALTARPIRATLTVLTARATKEDGLRARKSPFGLLLLILARLFVRFLRKSRMPKHEQTWVFRTQYLKSKKVAKRKAAVVRVRSDCYALNFPTYHMSKSALYFHETHRTKQLD